MTLNVTLVGQKELVQRLDALPDDMRKRLRVTIQGLVIKLQNHVVRDKLSGQVLKRRSGALSQSIQYKVSETGTAVIGEVYSAGNVKYAGIHEFGGKTPPHDIHPKTAGGVLAFKMGGKQVFAKVVHHPGSVMPQRSFLRSALTDQADDIRTALAKAVAQQAMQSIHGKVEA